MGAACILSVLPSPSWIRAGSFRHHFCLPELVQLQGAQLWRTDRLQPQVMLSAWVLVLLLGTAAGFEAEVMGTA